MSRAREWRGTPRLAPGSPWEHDAQGIVALQVGDLVNGARRHEDDIAGLDLLRLVAQPCRAPSRDHVEQLVTFLVDVDEGLAVPGERLLDEDGAAGARLRRCLDDDPVLEPAHRAPPSAKPSAACA